MSFFLIGVSNGRSTADRNFMEFRAFLIFGIFFNQIIPYDENFKKIMENHVAKITKKETLK